MLEPRVLLSGTLDINGVQPAALDQPQVHAIFRTSAGGNPLGGTGPDDGVGVQAYLDTGTSGVVLSQESADALGVAPTTSGGQPVTFTDIGIGGGQDYGVSAPLYGSLAPYTSLFTPDLPVSDYNQNFGPVRAEVTTTAADFLTGPLDIMGMPALAGKVMVMDPSAVNNPDLTQIDSLRTYVYSPGTPFNASTADSDPGIPATNFHVKVSYADFTPLTSIAPAGAAGPSLSGNPFIGPNPLAGVEPGVSAGNAPPITITQGGSSATGSFLFDTGAGSSFISQALAAKVGVHYAPAHTTVTIRSSWTPAASRWRTSSPSRWAASAGR